MIKFIFSYTKYIKSYFITVLFLLGTLTILNSLKPIILSGTFNLIVKELNFQVGSSGNNGTDTSKNFFDLNNLNVELKNLLTEKLATFEDKILFFIVTLLIVNILIYYLIVIVLKNYSFCKAICF